MFYIRRALMACAILAAASAAYFGPPMLKPAVATATVVELRHDTETAVVKVSRGGGHGSGVHIGDGYILTARHVVDAAYDIALRKVKEPVAGSAHLDCRTAAVGTEIIAMGSPMTIDFVSAFGRIAGEPREVMGLKSVFVTDITTVMGMSGGPVFDRQDNLIGITVAVMTAPLPTGPDRYSPSLVGFGFVVPSSAVCNLMARGEV